MKALGGMVRREAVLTGVAIVCAENGTRGAGLGCLAARARRKTTIYEFGVAEGATDANSVRA
tara:strand:+ start:1174 stop:1359 length:186 start_codon:yes stop_codon:yes gene_type:complete